MAENAVSEKVTGKVQPFHEIVAERFKENFVYTQIFKRTMKSANFSYFMAIILSILMFFVGVALIVAAIYLAFTNNDRILSIVFTGFGSTSIIVLLLSNPIERIQTAVNKLIESQIACLSFQAQYEIIYGIMVLKNGVFHSDDQELIDEQIKLANCLQTIASKLISDLSLIEGKQQKQGTEKKKEG